MAKPQVLFFSNNKVYSASKRDSRRQHTRIKANIGLIASTAVLLSSVRTEELMLRREGYKCYFPHFLFFFFILDFEISRVEAFVFILLDVTYFLFFSTSPTGSENHLAPLRFQTFNRKVF